MDPCGQAGAAVSDGVDSAYRRVLRRVLAINAVMFVAEGASGLIAGSVALQADALDFLGDAATYGITLYVLGRSVRWRAGAGLAKGAAMALFGLGVVGHAVQRALIVDVPAAAVMGSVGALALAANVISALLLFRHREGDSNRRSAWLCTRNDAIANLAVIAAAGGVFLTGAAWPDLIVGALVAALALGSGIHVMGQALGELRVAPGATSAEAGERAGSA